jgi:hypothetical protein
VNLKNKTMLFNRLNGIHRIELVFVAILFFMSAFSSTFVYKLYSYLPEAIKWLMVNIYNLIVVDFFSNIGFDSEFWWGFGRGLSTAIVAGLIFWILNKIIKWIYVGFNK